MSHIMRKPVYAICEQQRCTSACTSAQSSFYIRNFKPLASFCGCAGRFESDLVENPEDRFSRDKAHIFFRNLLRKLEGLQYFLSESSHDKTNKMTVHLAKTQISLGICPVWSESSLCPQWVAKNPSLLHADSKDSDQTRQMPRLICVFAGRTCHFFGFARRWLKSPTMTFLMWTDNEVQYFSFDLVNFDIAPISFI